MTLRVRGLRGGLVVAFGLANLAVAAVVSPVDSTGDGTGEANDATADEGAEAAAAAGSYLMDPQLVETTAGRWAVGSSNDNLTMPLFEEGDDGAWRYVGDALASQPAWASQGFLGPAVVELQGETWSLLFAAQSAASGRYCIGTATTDDLASAFEPAADPLLCPEDRDVVDPSVHRGDDGLVLTWAERTAGATTTETTTEPPPDRWEIKAAPLDLEGTSVGDAAVLLTGDPNTWEGGIVDGPALLEVGDQLVLLYSGNQWGSEGYALGYAVCEGPTGACERRTTGAPVEVPVDGADLVGVASAQPTTAAGQTEIALHGFTATEQAEPVTLLADVSWTADALAVGAATPLEVGSR